MSTRSLFIIKIKYRAFEPSSSYMLTVYMFWSPNIFKAPVEVNRGVIIITAAQRTQPLIKADTVVAGLGVRCACPTELSHASF